ncbi:MAG TPA: hypothetical protein VFQ88_16130 [Nevskiaceae bacterium]|nr:hypothetical protein [Nevskiaceae bacterium]
MAPPTGQEADHLTGDAGRHPQALVVADDPVYLGWLRKAAGERIDFNLMQTHDAERVMDHIDSGGGVDLLFCEFTSPTAGQRAALVARMQEQNWQIPVIGLGAEENTNWVLAAMRAGARDFLVLGRDDETLSGQLDRLINRSSASRTTRESAAARIGKLFTLLSAQPDEDLAFLAEHVALTLNEHLKPGERAILVDIAQPAGAASIFLNLNPTYGALDAARDAYRCDETLVEAAFSKHNTGLYVLSLPEDNVGVPQFEVPDLLELFDVLGKLFAYVVVAADSYLPTQGLAGLLERSERVLLVSDQTILKSRHSKHLLRQLRQENCKTEHVGLVVDHYRRRLGLEPKNLADLFEVPLVAAIADGTSNRNLAMNSGEPLFNVARKDPLCQTLRDLAGHLLQGSAAAAPQAARHRGWLSRLVG